MLKPSHINTPNKLNKSNVAAKKLVLNIYVRIMRALYKPLNT